ncbi:hypothetical protein MMS26_27440, partial [Escherichia coli]|nr:hypothetical protein [Escherichia coli]
QSSASSLSSGEYLPGSLQGKISSDGCLKKEQMVVSAIASTPQKAGTHKRGYRQVKGYSAGGPAVGVSELWFCCSLNVFLYVSVHVTDKGYY